MLKAIETHYNGYHFRSRLEARWAVLLDTINLEYAYEPEGFDLPILGKYLPDFNVSGCWLEIKPQPPLELEIGKMLELCMLSDKVGFITGGGFSANEIECISGIAVAKGVDSWQISIGFLTRHSLCKQLAFIASEYLPIGDYDISHALPYTRVIMVCNTCEKIMTIDSRVDEFKMSLRDMRKGIHAARSARFEFGQSG